MDRPRIVTRDRALIESRSLSRIGEIARQSLQAEHCAIISDDTVAPRFGQTVIGGLESADIRANLLSVSPGEKSKSLTQAGAICEQMTAAGLDRSSFVVALGGGVIGDLAGFVAAVYHRGIPWVNVPTTLLAMVDSSIGGKTGVNTAAGKNLIGAIHQPIAVIADLDTLDTLPPREFKQGFAEMIKHAVIADAEMLDELEEFDRGNLEALIRRSIEIKARIVATDERDISGERAILNFGHTIGHAIERAAGYGTYLHGEAISLGIVAACELSVRKAGLRRADADRVIAALQKFDLPTRLPETVPREAILEAVRFDKKFAEGQVRFVVAPRLGSATLTNDISHADIAAVVAQL